MVGTSSKVFSAVIFPHPSVLHTKVSESDVFKMAPFAKKQRVAAAVATILLLKKRKRRHRRSIWVRNFLQRRHQHGAYSALMRELRIEDPLAFKNFVRMSGQDFEELLRRVGPLISRKDTHYRESISAGERLKITLRFLASEDSFTGLMYLYRVSKQSISSSIPEVCDALYFTLAEFM